jgi:hypothetical protein
MEDPVSGDGTPQRYEVIDSQTSPTCTLRAVMQSYLIGAHCYYGPRDTMAAVHSTYSYADRPIMRRVSVSTNAPGPLRSSHTKLI